MYTGVTSMCGECVCAVCDAAEGTLSHSHTEERGCRNPGSHLHKLLQLPVHTGPQHPHRIHGPLHGNLLEARGVSDEKAHQGPGF